jgi:hypothetical protein
LQKDVLWKKKALRQKSFSHANRETSETKKKELLLKAQEESKVATLTWQPSYVAKKKGSVLFMTSTELMQSSKMSSKDTCTTATSGLSSLHDDDNSGEIEHNKGRSGSSSSSFSRSQTPGQGSTSTQCSCTVS